MSMSEVIFLRECREILHPKFLNWRCIYGITICKVEGIGGVACTFQMCCLCYKTASCSTLWITIKYLGVYILLSGHFSGFVGWSIHITWRGCCHLHHHSSLAWISKICTNSISSSLIQAWHQTFDLVTGEAEGSIQVCLLFRESFLSSASSSLLPQPPFLNWCFNFYMDHEVKQKVVNITQTFN